MKRNIWLLFMTVMLAFGCAGCGQKEDAEPADMKIAVMTGPTAIGMVKVMSDMEAGTAANNYTFSVYGTGDEIAAELLKGNLDAACVPCNLAAVLHQKSEGEIVTVAVNTLGVLYLVETGTEIQCVEDLRGKTIYSTGQGTTPEFTLRYLLSSAGIDPDKDVTIEYKSEAAEVAALLAEATDAVAMLPQPYVTAAMKQNASLRIALSVTEEWEKRNEDSTVVTGVLVARNSYIQEQEAAFAKFLEEYEASVAYAKEQVEETAEQLEHFNIFKAAIAKTAIPYCNVTYIDGEEMQKKVLAYLQVLYDQKPAAVGGIMPGAELFYMAE
ncbi:MAG: ABC transporter substrate-binding protein [Lachnospiraceae bacterium]|nr:ABC transporter substrate-binding protein [Lachnospiraceae bacterium]